MSRLNSLVVCYSYHFEGLSAVEEVAAPFEGAKTAHMTTGRDSLEFKVVSANSCTSELIPGTCLGPWRR